LLLTSTLSTAKYASCGAFGGYYYPVIQPESHSGHTFGFKIRVKLAYAFYLEPYFLQHQERDKEIITGGITNTYGGTTISSAGANLVVGTYLDNLVRPYAMMGIGIVKTQLLGETSESNRVGYNWGGGMEYSLVWKKLYLDVGAVMQLIELDNNLVHKNLNITAGLNWYFKYK
jgi:opacity protein-like surface antigen